VAESIAGKAVAVMLYGSERQGRCRCAMLWQRCPRCAPAREQAENHIYVIHSWAGKKTGRHIAGRQQRAGRQRRQLYSGR